MSQTHAVGNTQQEAAQEQRQQQAEGQQPLTALPLSQTEARHEGMPSSEAVQTSTPAVAPADSETTASDRDALTDTASDKSHARQVSLSHAATDHSQASGASSEPTEQQASSEQQTVDTGRRGVSQPRVQGSTALQKLAVPSSEQQAVDKGRGGGFTPQVQGSSPLQKPAADCASRLISQPEALADKPTVTGKDSSSDQGVSAASKAKGPLTQPNVKEHLKQPANKPSKTQTDRTAPVSPQKPAAKARQPAEMKRQQTSFNPLG